MDAKVTSSQDAARLRALIAKACLSHREFASRTGIPGRQFSRWCSGKDPIPPYVMLVAEHLGCCPVTEFEREERLGWTHEQMAREG